MSAQQTALIAGANGSVGQTLSEHLAGLGGWDVLTLARKRSRLQQVGTPVELDLLDRDMCLGKGAELAGVTHLFYAARYAVADLAEEDRLNTRMFTNLLDTLEAHATGLVHVQLVQGTKWYGALKGQYKLPAVEDEPARFPPNFYYSQQDIAEERAKPGRWTWSAIRPHTVWGVTVGHRHSFVVQLAVYATICRHLGIPMNFPASQGCFDSISQATDAGLMARGMVWAATSPQCANEAFNIVNGDIFQWRYFWKTVCDYFGVEAGPVVPTDMPTFMADKAPVWDEIVRRHDLAPTTLSDLADWKYFHQVLSDRDDISSTLKARRRGFQETIGNEEALFSLFARLRRDRIIP